MEPSELVERLKGSRYGRTPTEILTFAKTASELHGSLGPGERKEWLNQNGIHPDTWAKVMAVATATKIHDPKLIPRLPASLSTLSLLARLTEEVLNRAHTEGLITPNLSYRQLATWRKANVEVESPSSPITKLLPVVVALDPDTSGMDEVIILQAIQDALVKSKIRCQMITVNNWDRVEAQAESQWQRGVIEEGIKEINGLMSERQITFEELSQPLGSLHVKLFSEEDEDFRFVYALKMAYDCVFSESKQRRYQCRKMLINLAQKDNPVACKLARGLMGKGG